MTNQGRIRELDWGIQTLVQKGLLNFFIANYFSPTPHTPPQPLPLVAGPRYPPLVFGNNDCTEFVNAIVKVEV